MGLIHDLAELVVGDIATFEGVPKRNFLLSFADFIIQLTRIRCQISTRRAWLRLYLRSARALRSEPRRKDSWYMEGVRRGQDSRGSMDEGNGQTRMFGAVHRLRTGIVWREGPRRISRAHKEDSLSGRTDMAENKLRGETDACHTAK